MIAPHSHPQPTEWLPPRPADDHAPLPSRPRGNSYTERKDRGPRVVRCMTPNSLSGSCCLQSRFGPERQPMSTPAPPDDTPRVWMTREESERLHSTNKEPKQPELIHKLPERPVRAEPDSRRTDDVTNVSPSFNGNFNYSDRQSIREPVRHAEVPVASRRVNNGPPEYLSDRQSPIDARPRGRRSSLEGRISSYSDHVPVVPQSASLPPRPMTHKTFSESVPRHDNRDRRRDDGHHQDDRPTWDHPLKEPIRDESPGSAPKIHPDRARLLQPTPGPSESQDEPMKTSRPVRIRRPPPTKLPESLPEKPLPDTTYGRVDDHSRPDSLRRTGSSLLDRLTLDDPPPHMAGTSPSLRERMDAFGQGPSVHDEDGYGDMMDADVEIGQGELSRKGGRKRAPRPKRGRRGGMPA